MFYTDQPICSARDDLLGRGPFAKRLAHSILHFDPTDSYAVALQGRWGCGKRILIVIDDIDRLPNEQIRLIFQITVHCRKVSEEHWTRS